MGSVARQAERDVEIILAMSQNSAATLAATIVNRRAALRQLQAAGKPPDELHRHRESIRLAEAAFRLWEDVDRSRPDPPVCVFGPGGQFLRAWP